MSANLRKRQKNTHAQRLKHHEQQHESIFNSNTRAGIKVGATQSVQRQDAELLEKDVFEGRWVVLEDAGHDRWHGGHGGLFCAAEKKGVQTKSARV